MISIKYILSVAALLLVASSADALRLHSAGNALATTSDSEMPGPRAGSTFSSVKEACSACVKAWPGKGRCHAGACNWRDPNTQPMGGVATTG